MPMPDRKRSHRGGGLSRHASLDTNASGMAESTISLGLSRFPEPPASIPESPIASSLGTPSPSQSAFSDYPPSTAPLRVNARQPLRAAHPPNTYTRFTDHVPSTIQSSNVSSISTGDLPPSSSSQISPFDWHDGASSIDVDAAEGRLLPTSFITSLLRENKPKPRRPNRVSYAASQASSGISEMTYPPVLSHAEAERYRAAQVSNPVRGLPPIPPQQGGRAPPSAYAPHGDRHERKTSTDSDTLHSIQGYPFIVRSGPQTRGNPATDGQNVGLPAGAPRPVASGSASQISSQISSTVDGDTILGGEKGYQHKLSTTYETGSEFEYKAYSNQFSPALPSTAGLHGQFFKENARHSRRESVHSTKSSAPTFRSRVSSLRRVFGKRKGKPLPPVPTIPDIPLAEEHAYRKLDELSPLPDLVNRAGALRELLENGHHPHQSVRSFHPHQSLRSFPGFNQPTASYGAYEPSTVKTEYSDNQFVATSYKSSRLQMSGTPSHQVAPANAPNRKKRRIYIIIAVIVIVVLAAVGIGVGISLGKKKPSSFNCPGNFTGSLCNLDATCVCTSSAQCNPLARSVVQLLPTVNTLFTANYSTTSAYSSIWLMQGTPSALDCTPQALLMDPGSGLSPAMFPNRTQWAQAALLWNALQTEDPVTSQKVQQSVQGLPWKSLTGGDGPVAGPSNAFAVNAPGYTFNFASQTISQPFGSFITLGQPLNAQIGRVSKNAQSTLDRMYTFAQASATQRQTALKKYWTTVLQQRAEDLSLFKSILLVSPVVLPFNASSRSIRNLYTGSPSSPFPPPLSCFPGLNSPLQERLISFESTVYGLPPISNPSQFDPSCYRDRPVYGVLDILRLRLPFTDSRIGVSKQAAVLTRDAAPRVIVYTGEIFAAALNGTVNLTPTELDPRHYGTLGLSDHVILRYLKSMPNLSVATAVAQYVLSTASTTPTPPDPSSPLYQSLDSIPTLEIAVFGDVGASDFSSILSPFTNPSGSLFFGSDDGNALRTWTINTMGGPVVWTQNATSPLVVRDKSLGDTTITKTWDAITLALTNNIPNIGLVNITTTLTGTQDFTP